jgi:hypothetical protein
VQRPSNALVVRQPAGRGVSPGPGAGRPTGPDHLPRRRPRHTRRRQLSHGRAGRPPGPPGAGRGAGGRRQDQWGQGRPRVRPRRRHGVRRGSSAGHPGDRRSGCSARSRGGHHRVHEAGPGGEGLRRCHPGRRGDRRLGLQPPCPSRCPRLVPRRLGRPRWRCAGGLHRAHGTPARGGSQPVGRTHAPTAAGERRPRRRGPSHPRRPGGGDARGQARGPSPLGRGSLVPATRRRGADRAPCVVPARRITQRAFPAGLAGSAVGARASAPAAGDRDRGGVVPAGRLTVGPPPARLCGGSSPGRGSPWWRPPRRGCRGSGAVRCRPRRPHPRRARRGPACRVGRAPP